MVSYPKKTLCFRASLWLPFPVTISACKMMHPAITRNSSSVVDGTLVAWNRRTGSDCPDIARLRVWAEASVKPCSTFGHDHPLPEDYIVLKSGEACIYREDYDQDGHLCRRIRQRLSVNAEDREHVAT